MSVETELAHLIRDYQYRLGQCLSRLAYMVILRPQTSSLALQCKRRIRVLYKDNADSTKKTKKAQTSRSDIIFLAKKDYDK